MEPLTREEVDRNTLKQASKILKFIGESYDLGLFEDPASSHRVCSLLALICEGCVEGTIDSSSNLVSWSLTKEYQEQLTVQMTKLAEMSENVVKGPW